MIWESIFIMNLLLPLLTLFVGVVLLVPRHKKSHYAQRYFGKVCCIEGAVLILAVSGCMLLVLGEGENTIRVTGSLIGIAEALIGAASFMLTEYLLKKSHLLL